MARYFALCFVLRLHLFPLLTAPLTYSPCLGTFPFNFPASLLLSPNKYLPPSLCLARTQLVDRNVLLSPNPLLAVHFIFSLFGTYSFTKHSHVF